MQPLTHLQGSPWVLTFQDGKCQSFQFRLFSSKWDDNLNSNTFTKDFHGRFSVWIVSRFEPDLINSYFLIEL